MNKDTASKFLNFTLPKELIDRISTTYIIEGTPSPLKRARFYSRGVYDSQKQEKLLLGINLRNQHDSDDIFDGVLHFNITFHFPYPSNPKEKKKLSNQFFHIYRPDLSNLVKMIEDVCVDTEIITDDAIIASMFSAKVYSDKPKTTFQIIRLKGENEK